jgi:hypothetical protein
MLFNRLRRARREQRLIRAGWYDVAARSSVPAIFVGGCGRSGTTLLREMLARHPDIACGPETSMFGLPFELDNLVDSWAADRAELEREVARAANLLEFADWFYREKLLRVEGKPRWADKTPNNIRVIGKLLTWYPEGRFIHIIRDGRDVACSLRHHPRQRFVNGQLAPVRRDNPISLCATRWVQDTCGGLPYRDHPRYHEVRYENLVRDPEAELRRICSFLDEPYVPEMLTGANAARAGSRESRLANNENADGPITPKMIGRWRTDLRPEERSVFLGIAGELLIALGYVTDHAWAETDPDLVAADPKDAIAR